jgi:transmembrane sensor
VTAFSASSAPDAVLLDRYLAGECTPAESTLIEAWLAESADRKIALEVLREGRARDAYDWAADAGWREVVARMTGGSSQALPMSADHRAPEAARLGLSKVRERGLGRQPLRQHARALSLGRSSRRAWIVASLGITAIASVVTDAWQRVAPVSPAHVYTTLPGQRMTVRLADGASAALEPASRLSVRQDKAVTTVALTGQATFTVDHRRQNAFAVTTANTVTRVLGTTFVVRRYDDDRATTVVVTDGRVSLRSSGERSRNAIPLSAGMRGVVDDSTAQITTSILSNADRDGWASRGLVFRDTPVQQIAADLSRAYGVQIRIADSATATQRLSWRVFPARNTLAEVLDDLPLMLDVHITWSGKTVTLQRGRRTTEKPAMPHSPFSAEKNHGR